MIKKNFMQFRSPLGFFRIWDGLLENKLDKRRKTVHEIGRLHKQQPKQKS